MDDAQVLTILILLRLLYERNIATGAFVGVSEKEWESLYEEGV